MLHPTKTTRPRTARPSLHPVIEALRKARYDQCMTVQMLAKITGYSAKAIYQWENGATSPKLRQMRDWAQALGMRLTVETKND